MAIQTNVNGCRVIQYDDTDGSIVNIGVIKNGFDNTGYSEPFITDVELSNGALSTHVSLRFDGKLDDAQNYVADGMRIENTVFKNSVSFGLVAYTDPRNNIIGVFENPSYQFRVGDIIEYDFSVNKDRSLVYVYEVTEKSFVEKAEYNTSPNDFLGSQYPNEGSADSRQPHEPLSMANFGDQIVYLTVADGADADIYDVIPIKTVLCTTGRKLYLGDGTLAAFGGSAIAGSHIQVPVTPETIWEIPQQPN